MTVRQEVPQLVAKVLVGLRHVLNLRVLAALVEQVSKAIRSIKWIVSVEEDALRNGQLLVDEPALLHLVLAVSVAVFVLFSVALLDYSINLVAHCFKERLLSRLFLRLLRRFVN